MKRRVTASRSNQLHEQYCLRGAVGAAMLAVIQFITSNVKGVERASRP